MEVYPAIYGAIGHVSPHLMEWPNTNANGTSKVFPCSAELTHEYLVAMEHIVGSALQIEMEREVEKRLKRGSEEDLGRLKERGV